MTLALLLVHSRTNRFHSGMSLALRMFAEAASSFGDYSDVLFISWMFLTACGSNLRCHRGTAAVQGLVLPKNLDAHPKITKHELSGSCCTGTPVVWRLWSEPESVAIYVIFKRLNTETFTKSTAKANVIAPATTIPNSQSGSGIMSQPHPASVKAITKSAIDDMMSQRLG